MNPIKGEVPLVLHDGRELTLVLDMEALIQAETVYGKPLPVMMGDVIAGFTGAARAMLYGALRANHPAISVKAVTDLFMTDGDAITSALEQAVMASLPELDGDVEGKEGKNPPGKRSGRSGAKRGSNREPSGK